MKYILRLQEQAMPKKINTSRILARLVKQSKTQTSKGKTNASSLRKKAR